MCIQQSTVGFIINRVENHAPHMPPHMPLRHVFKSTRDRHCLAKLFWFNLRFAICLSVLFKSTCNRHCLAGFLKPSLAHIFSIPLTYASKYAVDSTSNSTTSQVHALRRADYTPTPRSGVQKKVGVSTSPSSWRSWPLVLGLHASWPSS